MNELMLDAEIVRKELEILIERYPGNTGTFGTDDNCVYYADQDGYAVQKPSTLDVVAKKEVILTHPVCIVGYWIEEFHPEFKENPAVLDMLCQNSTVAGGIGHIMPPEVTRLLDNAQMQQDRPGRTWLSIDLDEETWK